MTRNKFDQAAYNKRYYAINRNEERARVEERRQTVTATLRRMKEVPCADCSNVFPPYVMDFDHRDPRDKLANVMWMAGKAATATVMAETAKCDIVCANCHTIRTLRQPRNVARSELHETARQREGSTTRKASAPLAQCALHGLRLPSSAGSDAVRSP